MQDMDKGWWCTPKSAQQGATSVLKKQGREWLRGGLWFPEENYSKEMRFPINAHSLQAGSWGSRSPTSPPSCLQNTSPCLAVSKHTSEARGQREIQCIKFSFLGAKESGEGQGVLEGKAQCSAHTLE